MNFNLTEKFLDSLIEYGLSGIDCAVYVKGEQVYRHMNGWANIGENRMLDTSTIYQMYSMTKPITCTAALMMYENGLFNMDDPVSLYLPSFKDMKVAVKDQSGKAVMVPAKSEPTIFNLFTMTAGLTYDLESPSLLKLYRNQPDFTTRQFADAIAQEPLAYHPGEHWSYSLAHDILAACCEVWTGERFDNWCKTNIFLPLGMKHTYFHVPENERAHCAGRYYFVENKHACKMVPYGCTYQRSINHESGGAGLNATVDDYGKFACTMTGMGKAKNGQRLLGSGMVRAMTANCLHDRLLQDYWQSTSKIGYGYGLGVRTMIDVGLGASPSNPGEFGWSGAAGTYVLMDPSAELTIVYAQQSEPNTNNYVQRRLRNLIYRAIEA